MKKGILVSLLLLFTCTLWGCEKEATSVNILCPAGAPALAFVSEYEDIMETGKIDIVDGSDLLLSELSKKDSDYDIIVAPINLGAKLIENKATDYRIHSVLTWGNLYLVASDEADLTSSDEIALFGQGAVPEKIYEISSTDIALSPIYYNSASLVQQQLLAQKVQVGMLAEPLASATIAKAKQNGLHLSIVMDLQKQSKIGENGYPQAAIFVKEDVDDVTLFDAIDEFTNEGYPDLETHIREIGIETLQLPSVELAVKSIERQNIHYQRASEVKEEISSFLKLFNIHFTEDMIYD